MYTIEVLYTNGVHKDLEVDLTLSEIPVFIFGLSSQKAFRLARVLKGKTELGVYDKKYCERTLKKIGLMAELREDYGCVGQADA